MKRGHRIEFMGLCWTTHNVMSTCCTCIFLLLTFRLIQVCSPISTRSKRLWGRVRSALGNIATNAFGAIIHICGCRCQERNSPPLSVMATGGRSTSPRRARRRRAYERRPGHQERRRRGADIPISRRGDEMAEKGGSAVDGSHGASVLRRHALPPLSTIPPTSTTGMKGFEFGTFGGKIWGAAAVAMWICPPARVHHSLTNEPLSPRLVPPAARRGRSEQSKKRQSEHELHASIEQDRASHILHGTSTLPLSSRSEIVAEGGLGRSCLPVCIRFSSL